MTIPQLMYLHKCVTADLRRKERALNEFRAKPGQDPALAAAAKLKVAQKVLFLQGLARDIKYELNHGR